MAHTTARRPRPTTCRSLSEDLGPKQPQHTTRTHDPTTRRHAPIAPAQQDTCASVYTQPGPTCLDTTQRRSDRTTCTPQLQATTTRDRCGTCPHHTQRTTACRCAPDTSRSDTRGTPAILPRTPLPMRRGTSPPHTRCTQCCLAEADTDQPGMLGTVPLTILEMPMLVCWQTA